MKNCQICAAAEPKCFLSLGHQPPSDEFLLPERLSASFEVYPLDLFYCENCGLVQLGYSVDPEKLFNDYAYNTGTSGELRRQFQELAEVLISQEKLGPNDLVVDIGSNDGTLLAGFQKAGVSVLGVEPSSVASIAIERGVRTKKAFFNEAVAKEVREEFGLARIITATNVFAHVRELDSFMKGIAVLLKPKGLFITESHYLLSLVQKLQYDAIYHEHLRYYSLKPLQRLFARYGLEVISAQEVPSHGGSIRVYAAHCGAYPVDEALTELLQCEIDAGLYSFSTFESMARRIEAAKFELLSLLIELKREGKRIVGIGAPAKGNTLLNYCQLRGDMIDYLAEHSALKIGRYAPGSLIPVLHEDLLFKEQPDYGLLLSWNLKNLIVPKLREKGFTGRFIIPGEHPSIE